jgi:hypothetical protein
MNDRDDFAELIGKFNEESNYKFNQKPFSIV